MPFAISSMLNPSVYDHPVREIELIETHISWVILTGDYAYKIKKPINFGFLDFSTLEKRKQCCEQEVQLNRRLAPDIYLHVVAISGSKNHPVIAESDSRSTLENIQGEHVLGTTFEYAVKMTQFSQSAQLDNRLASGELRLEHMDSIALMMADFHSVIEVADDAMPYGEKEMIYRPVAENFSLIGEHLATDHSNSTQALNKLQSWSASEFSRLEIAFEQRKQRGYIRECHGDMHLRNLVWLHDQPVAFDCIEFNAALRWIDVMSEVAFLFMDLQARQQPRFAHRLLNSYLEQTGDYAGLAVFPFYLCYRAMVRAKVNILRLEQEDSRQEKQQTLDEFIAYLQLATTYTEQPKPKLVIMRGVSASGKSTVSQQLATEIGAIRLRSDIERKRLFNVPFLENHLLEDDLAEIDQGLYSAEATQQTYKKLIKLASQVIQAGYTVIVDAAFLKYSQRVCFQQLASELSVPYRILQITAPADVLRQRILNRKHEVSDATLKVLENQLAHWQPLRADESSQSTTVNTEESWKLADIMDNLNQGS